MLAGTLELPGRAGGRAAVTGGEGLCLCRVVLNPAEEVGQSGQPQYRVPDAPGDSISGMGKESGATSCRCTACRSPPSLVVRKPTPGMRRTSVFSHYPVHVRRSIASCRWQAEASWRAASVRARKWLHDRRRGGGAWVVGRRLAQPQRHHRAAGSHGPQRPHQPHRQRRRAPRFDVSLALAGAAGSSKPGPAVPAGSVSV